MHEQKVTKLGLRKLHFPKKMGSIFGHRIDYMYNGVRGSEKLAAHTKQKLTQVPTPHPLPPPVKITE